jgi:hypothetical protein
MFFLLVGVLSLLFSILWLYLYLSPLFSLSCSFSTTPCGFISPLLRYLAFSCSLPIIWLFPAFSSFLRYMVLSGLFFFIGFLLPFLQYLIIRLSFALALLFGFGSHPLRLSAFSYSSSVFSRFSPLPAFCCFSLVFHLLLVFHCYFDFLLLLL